MTIPFLALAGNDLRNAFRDKVLLILLVLPLLLFPVFRLILPVIADQLPLVVDYYLPILAFFCVLVTLLPVFLLSFMMLDEKDDRVWLALRVLPISPKAYLASRMGFMVLLSFSFTLLSLLFSGLVEVGMIQALALALQICLLGPIGTLAVVSFARNKIEGLSLLKGLFFLFMLPILVFFVDMPLIHALGIFPLYWTFQAFKTLNSDAPFWLFLSVGLGFNLGLIFLLYRPFRARVF